MKKISSPMAGTVWKIVKAVGDEVDYGDTVVILESMKMEIPVEADNRGKISRILAEEGQVVDEGTPLIELA
ncbi:biotin/lipoyl-binding carrier protein [Ferrovibrio sp. MS7]|jgi:acetyl-CoA carboxylase biotin carboxyl carrier protein|uniref:biotin/lipoyl-binding carrier protein n=1 Tax=Ferrovibrio plantarum TaxID=3119164 RepID=UPI003134C609